MRKKTTKLVLTKETVRTLAGVGLKQVAGGTFTWPTWNCPSGDTCRCQDSDGPFICISPEA